MKKLLIICLCLIMMSGCSSSDTEKKEENSTDTSSTDSLDDTFYPMVNLGTNIIRENYDNQLTEDERKHVTEVELEEYQDYDYVVRNTTKERLFLEADRIMQAEDGKDGDSYE